MRRLGKLRAHHRRDVLHVHMVPPRLRGGEARTHHKIVALHEYEEANTNTGVIDKADEVDDELRLIKGGGGALLREKIVAHASSRMVVIADRSKHVRRLGAFPLPVEVVPFALPLYRRLDAREI